MNKNNLNQSDFSQKSSEKLDFISENYRGFDPDFILWRVFGYQNYYLSTDEGIFEIFEAVKVNDQHLEINGNKEAYVLKGYKSETDSEHYPAYNDKNKEYVETLETSRGNKNKQRLITPRSLIRRKTNNISDSNEMKLLVIPYRNHEMKKSKKNIEEVSILQTEKK